MASNYPTSKDTFAQPTDPSTAALSSAGAGGNTRPHLEHHRDLGDVLEAVQDKVGYGAGIASDTFVSGLWNSPEGPTGGTNPAQDLLCLRRFVFATGTQFTQLAVWVQTANTASSVFRFGVYEDDGTGCYPGARLLDAGVTTADLSTTGFKSCTAFSATDVGGRVIWLGGATQVAALVANGLSGISSGGQGMAIATVPNVNAMQSYTQSGVTGALPSTFTATRAVTNAWPRVFYK